MGKFFITKNSKGKYYFNYLNNNDQNVLESEEYVSALACESAIDNLKILGTNIENYVIKKIPSGYYFQIQAKNGMILSTSGVFTVKRSVDILIQNIIKDISSSPVQFKSLEEIIEIQSEEIKEKDQKLEQTSEKQSKGMLNIFSELKRDFSHEERLWLAFGFYIFLVLFAIASALISLISPIISAYANIVLIAVISLIVWSLNSNKKDDYNAEPGEYFLVILILFSTLFPVVYFIHEAYMVIIGGSSSWAKIIGGEIGLNQLENIIPLSLILFSVLWFSVHQYGRAKKLRIEQQNKQAMIHFMQAIIANDGKGSYAERIFPQLAPFFANAIIHRPFSQENYEPQLPVDKLFQMAKDAKDIIK